ncbi:SDR family NAD(P)-dependent oxidoreductase [Streptomonospora salina]|uniref:Short-subunit dehydrogenase n=1 Tax=Streptomonospora salina TaxID=104205 RepID=A0A841ED30_9ACTN|nr:SDR family NAD(P)-dependent oxidoreductase [Streptomonospora salina]MBB5998973.1 short-subunit dehydrogenase [Streptomonospora salina]
MSETESSNETGSAPPGRGVPHRRTALVTGASAGIGAEFARLLAHLGYDLVLVARRAERIEALAAELSAECGVSAAALPADLADAGDLARVEERLRADGTGDAAPVDLLVNNAGIGGGGDFARQDPAEIDTMLDLNVRAVVRLARAVIPVQIDRRRRAGLAADANPRMGVVNVSSMAGELAANPGGSVYGATKSFVRLWSESVAAETAGRGVRVTAVLPGFVRTDMTEGVQEKGLPDIAFVSKERVVAESLRAWAAGRDSVVPGAQYKAAGGLLRLIPGALFKTAARRGGSEEDPHGRD